MAPDDRPARRRLPARARRRRSLLVAAVVIALAAGACSGTESERAAAPPAAGAVATEVPPPTSVTSLASVLERAVREEHHALATYQNVVAALGEVRPFVNIISSEQQHVAALEQVAAANGVDVAGVTADGDPSPTTVEDACALGVAAEQADGALYDVLLPLVADHPDVVLVMQRLRSASLDNHLPAFERCGSAGQGRSNP